MAFSTRTQVLRVFGMLLSLTGIIIILFGGVKTPENFRVVSDIFQNVCLITFILLFFFPDAPRIRKAMGLGLFVLIYDFILETIAVKLDWWYPLGGTQAPPLLIIPLEMVLSFFLIGTATYLILDAPDQIRACDSPPLVWLRPLFRNPRYDKILRVLYITLNAIVGTNGDYTAGPEIWVPGPTWHPVFTFLVWLSGGLLALGVFYGLKTRDRKDTDIVEKP